MENENLEKRIRSLNDADLLQVLKLRDSYTPEAATIAIEEALSRGLIGSEEDLEQAQFQPDATHRKSIFPYLNEKKQFQRVFSSLIRLLYLVAVLPLLFGVLMLTDHQFVNAVSFLVVGGAWLTFSVLANKYKDSRFPLVLILVLLSGIALTLSDNYLLTRLHLTDFVVIGLAIAIMIYILLYLRVLLVRRKRQSGFSA